MYHKDNGYEVLESIQMALYVHARVFVHTIINVMFP